MVVCVTMRFFAVKFYLELKKKNLLKLHVYILRFKLDYKFYHV